LKNIFNLETLKGRAGEQFQVSICSKNPVILAQNLLEISIYVYPFLPAIELPVESCHQG